MQKHINLVDLVKSFPTNIFLQNLASIQPRTNPIKFAHLAEKSEKGSISNLSTKAAAGAASGVAGMSSSPTREGHVRFTGRPMSSPTPECNGRFFAAACFATAPAPASRGKLAWPPIFNSAVSTEAAGAAGAARAAGAAGAPGAAGAGAFGPMLF